ncbi:UvrD-helicase domain-containing protein [Candidatus Laterigemmans baculatus]|uniref:UvrD-helicase domain-containing protein n=1 Tax=Candidatus Laterigemmans baculatus TaxID=2770505 RepID=UPI0013DCF060|nr:UvrD-helicase domain-containing protein [Candidatus Laterigemmans baculatus]
MDGLTLPPLLVRASAGTGKTYRLTGRLLTVLLGGADVESVLATTFTRKAAGEILDRVLVTLARAAEEPEALEALRGQVEIAGLSAADCQRLLHRLMRDIHRLRVCTLDSLFSQLARSFAFELRLPPGWRLTDEIEEAWMRRRAIDTMLADIDGEILSTLLSMLGKGDTARSVDRELQGIVLDAFSESRWCPPSAWESLQVPSAPESAELTRAAGVLGSALVGHKSADAQLRKLGMDLESRHWPGIVGHKLIGDVAGRSSGDDGLTYYRKPLGDDVVAALETAFAGAKTEVLGLLRLQTEATGEVLRSYAEHVDAIKHQSRAMGFDDVAFRLARWIDSVAIDTLDSRMDGSIHHVLLDEFQDTAPAQWSVLRPLALRAATDPPRTTFFCVGDTKQAIYGWRGGRAAIFDAVAEQIPGVEQATQDLSFRSSPVITQFVTNVFQHLGRHPKFSDSQPVLQSREDYEAAALQQFAAQFPRHASAKTTLPGFVRLHTGPEVDAEGAGASARREVARLRYVADEVARLAGEAPGRTIGILTRTNRSVAYLIYLLRELGVDVSQEGGNPLTDSGAVEVVLSALRMAEHPGDRRWAYHVSHSPLSALLELPAIGPRRRDDRVADRVDAAATRVRERLEYEGLAATLIWLSRSLIPICSESDATRLRQLLGLAHAYELNRQPRISSFVELVQQKRVERPRPAQVRVMTIHQAKGLEFDTVVLPELGGTLVRQTRKCIARTDGPTEPPRAMLRYLSQTQWQMLPAEWREAFGQHAAGLVTEALCLLYVAVTRPRHALHMIIDRAAKRSFETRTPASLLYHALGCTEDPTQSTADLFTAGDAGWARHLSPLPEPSAEVSPAKPIYLQPPPPVPNR